MEHHVTAYTLVWMADRVLYPTRYVGSEIKSRSDQYHMTGSHRVVLGATVSRPSQTNDGNIRLIYSPL